MKVLAGTQFRHIRDSDNKPLTDARLKDLAAETHPWAGAVYDQTSGWVHLSVNHMMTTIRADEDDSFQIRVPLPRDLVPGRLWLEILEAACQATEEFFAWVELWEANKGLPPGQARDLTAR